MQSSVVPSPSHLCFTVSLYFHVYSLAALITGAHFIRLCRVGALSPLSKTETSQGSGRLINAAPTPWQPLWINVHVDFLESGLLLKCQAQRVSDLGCRKRWTAYRVKMIQPLRQVCQERQKSNPTPKNNGWHGLGANCCQCLATRRAKRLQEQTHKWNLLPSFCNCTKKAMPGVFFFNELKGSMRLMRRLWRQQKPRPEERLHATRRETRKNKKRKNGGVEGEIEAGRLRPEEEGEKKKKRKKKSCGWKSPRRGMRSSSITCLPRNLSLRTPLRLWFWGEHLKHPYERQNDRLDM